ncbi:hypothetical protein AMTRI_Chr10g228570 [Amborella trichopoda]
MAHSHVPEFGNWESGENVPYTQYFENAVKTRGTGGKIMNPNDPEENPEAFRYGTADPKSFDASPLHLASTSPKRRQYERHQSDVAERHGYPMYSPSRYDSGARKVMHGSPIHGHTSYGRDMQSQGNSGSSPLRVRKSSRDGGHGLSPTSPVRFRSKGGNSRDDDQLESVAAVPKFGAWDDRDPTSGDGFTVLFNKVKEERQIRAAKPPVIPTKPVVYPTSYKKHNGSTRSSICCCFSPRND